MVNGDEKIHAQGAAAILDAVHVEQSSSWTVGSMVADLTKGIVYLYYFHQFDSPVIIIGPIGLVIWLIAGRKQEFKPWQTILVESVGDVTVCVIGFFVVLLELMQYPMEQSLQLLLLISIPFLIGWLFYQSLSLNFVSKKGYFHTLIQRLPHSLIVTNLGVAGIFPSMLTIANMSAQIPLPPWMIIAWWGFTAVYAIISILLLSVFHLWTVKQGFQAWTILAEKDEEMYSGRWKKLWWWIPVILVALIASLLAFSLFQARI
jgi:hypothetical protein